LFHHRLRALPLLILLLLTAACGQNTPEPPDTQPSADPTQVVVRILNLDLALTGRPPTAVPPTATPAPTPTPFPTFTPVPTAAQAGIQASPTPGCTNQAEFIKHLTINDNASLDREAAFAKLWQVKNVGTCTWTTAYLLVYVTGDQLSGPVSQPLPQEVPPGQSVDLRLNLIAPATPGPYTSAWMLQDPNGNRFGIGADGSQPLSLLIAVKTPPPAPPS